MTLRAGLWGAVLAALALACASPAPTPSPAPPAPPPPASASAAPLLWRAQAPDGRGDLFLLGSIHLGTPAGFHLGGALAEAWERSEELVVEIDVSQVSPQEAAAATLRHGTLPVGITLADRLRPETWAALQAELARLGVPAESFAGLKPWLAATRLAVLQFQQAGLEARFGIDQQMLDWAGVTKPVVALESLDSQLAMLDSLPSAVQELMLVDALERSPAAELQAGYLVESWLRGDEDALVEVFFGEIGQRPELEVLYEKVYFERNEAMSERLLELARDGRTRLTVLGIGHMVGPRGIPALLAAQGFQVERIR